jgi:protein TonB
MLFLFSSALTSEKERVYHVALAELSQAGVPQEPSSPEVPEPAAETPPPPPFTPEPEPEILPPPPDPTPEPPKEPEPKAVSTIKPTPPVQAQTKPKPVPPAAQPSTPPQQGTSASSAQAAFGPRPRQIGGLSAYDHDHVDQRPSISRRIAPEYPAKAKRMNIEGSVTVELVVDVAGLPKECSIRSADPPGYFEEAALSAARKMRFIPGKLKGTPVNTMVRLPFAFQLR